MRLLLPSDVEGELTEALRSAGQREIGGILMGEHVGVDRFAVRDITIQREGGSFAAFVRILEAVLAPLKAFFDRTGHDYTRFNYLGEWHSHHSFALIPSRTDHASMLALINDPKVGARFVVLLIVALDEYGKLQGALTVYEPGIRPSSGTIEFE